MRTIQPAALLAALTLLLSNGETRAQSGSCSDMSLGPGANLNGYRPFPDDNAWNTNIAALPVDPNSANFISFIGADSPLHPDFGAGLYAGSAIGSLIRSRPGRNRKWQSNSSLIRMSLTRGRCPSHPTH